MSGIGKATPEQQKHADKAREIVSTQSGLPVKK